MSVSMAMAFGGGRDAVRFSPSRQNPRISLTRSNCASPWSHFFLEIESLPPTCPVISGGGNNEWMVWSAARATRLMRVRSLLSTAPKM
jgi:hypothetical protein